MKLAKFVGIGAVGVMAALVSVSVAMGDRDTPSAPAPTPSPAVLNEALADGSYKIDGVHSSLVFRIKHNDVAYFYGRFNKISGTFTLNAQDASKNAAEVTIQADSVDTAVGGRDNHLKSQDFFSAGEFPTIAFKTREWKSAGTVDGEAAYDVVGDLTLLGKTKEIPVQIRQTGSAKDGALAGLEAKFTIKRSEFGMNKNIGSGLGDDVTIVVGLEGKRS